MQLLWEEARQTFDGRLYEVRHAEFESEADANKCASTAPLCQHSPTQRLYNYEMTPVMRAKVRLLRDDVIAAVFTEEGSSTWHVVILISRRVAPFPREMPSETWFKTVAARTLPSVEQLRNEPALRIRHALGRARTADELSRVIHDLQIPASALDNVMANGLLTVLTQAIARNDKEMINRLLGAGANINACGHDYCPLQMAVLMKKDPKTVELLLQAGADPDLFLDDFTSDSPLNLAANWNLEVTRLLLAYKAAPNPEKGEFTPLMAAANKEIAQALLDAGADPLVVRKQRLGDTTVMRPLSYFALPDADFQNWLREITLEALRKTGKLGFTVWFEQGGQRFNVADKATVTLKRVPFKIVFSTPNDANFMLVASEDGGLFSIYENAMDFHTALHPLRNTGYKKDNRLLPIHNLGRDKDGELLNLAHTHWDYSGGPEFHNGLKLVKRKGKPIYVHDIDTISLDGNDIPVHLYNGDSIYLVIGQGTRLGAGADIYGATRVRLNFK